MLWKERTRSYDLFWDIEKMILKRCHLNQLLTNQWESSEGWFSTVRNAHMLIITQTFKPLGWDLSFTEALEGSSSFLLPDLSRRSTRIMREIQGYKFNHFKKNEILADTHGQGDMLKYIW